MENYENLVDPTPWDVLASQPAGLPKPQPPARAEKVQFPITKRVFNASVSSAMKNYENLLDPTPWDVLAGRPAFRNPTA